MCTLIFSSECGKKILKFISNLSTRKKNYIKRKMKVILASALCFLITIAVTVPFVAAGNQVRNFFFVHKNSRKGHG